MTDIWPHIGARIAAVLNKPFTVERHEPVAGGCISHAYVIAGAAERYFVKLNHAAMGAMFEAEAEALREIADTRTVRVPRPLCWGTAEGTAYLVMEYIALGGEGAHTAQALGKQLAAMHRVTAAEFGWRVDNYIGSTPQPNTPDPRWPDFWRRQRLGHQLELAAANGYGGGLAERGERLMDALPALFDGHAPAASLLHGDLWAGNWASDRDGGPVVFDPAVYFGDREADIAMTELFGGFPPPFYQAYRAELPIDPGYAVRKRLYNLYHILNHLNLFGGGYLSQAQRLIDGLLGEVG